MTAFPIARLMFEAICTVTGSTVSGACAGRFRRLGGCIRAGGAGGLAQGGGIAVAFQTLPSSFLVTVSACTLSGDSAIGGAGGSGWRAGMAVTPTVVGSSSTPTRRLRLPMMRSSAIWLTAAWVQRTAADQAVACTFRALVDAEEHGDRGQRGASEQ